MGPPIPPNVTATRIFTVICTRRSPLVAKNDSFAEDQSSGHRHGHLPRQLLPCPGWNIEMAKNWWVGEGVKRGNLFHSLRQPYPVSRPAANFCTSKKTQEDSDDSDVHRPRHPLGHCSYRPAVPGLQWRDSRLDPSAILAFHRSDLRSVQAEIGSENQLGFSYLHWSLLPRSHRCHLDPDRFWKGRTDVAPAHDSESPWKWKIDSRRDSNDCWTAFIQASISSRPSIRSNLSSSRRLLLTDFCLNCCS